MDFSTSEGILSPRIKVSLDNFFQEWVHEIYRALYFASEPLSFKEMQKAIVEMMFVENLRN